MKMSKIDWEREYRSYFSYSNEEAEMTHIIPFKRQHKKQEQPYFNY